MGHEELHSFNYALKIYICNKHSNTSNTVNAFGFPGELFLPEPHMIITIIIIIIITMIFTPFRYITMTGRR